MATAYGDRLVRTLPGRTAEAHILNDLVDLLAKGRSAVLATVISTDRSVPRHAGSKMLVTADGLRIGSVGGGEMEARVVAETDACLAEGTPRLLDYQLVDPGNGDPGVCGGRATILLEPHMPPSTILVIGYGHIGHAVTDLAHWLGYRVVATDDRSGTLDDSSAADVAVVGPVSVALEQVELTPRDHAVVVTRNTDLDVESIQCLLATSVGSIGVMGSARRWETTCSRLLDLGATTADLERVTSPIGLDLGAENPEEIAVSVMAQIVARDRSSAG
ncbi:MAG: XdhC family protein [Acidimicrobiia bacterium]|nr:XdhC family protein [Actinomycetota bacterium]MBL6927161.1 XdhC family protein [Acidimicrobiia bacterium]